MRPTLLLLAAVSLAAARPVQTFNGLGQLRTNWRDGDHDDLGCLTDEGRWTTDETRCGTFEAVPVPEIPTLFTLQSAAGFCKVYGAKFTCEKDAEPYQFGIWPETYQLGIPGSRVLRWGQYGLMASDHDGPPARTDSPQEIHLATYREPGKFVWLTWLEL